MNCRGVEGLGREKNSLGSEEVGGASFGEEPPSFYCFLVFEAVFCRCVLRDFRFGVVEEELKRKFRRGRPESGVAVAIFECLSAVLLFGLELGACPLCLGPVSLCLPGRRGLECYLERNLHQLRRPLKGGRNP